MLLAALGNRTAGAILLTAGVLTAMLAWEHWNISGGGGQACIAGGVASLALLAGLEFTLRCPVLKRLARF